MAGSAQYVNVGRRVEVGWKATEDTIWGVCNFCSDNAEPFLDFCGAMYTGRELIILPNISSMKTQEVCEDLLKCFEQTR